LLKAVDKEIVSDMLLL